MLRILGFMKKYLPKLLLTAILVVILLLCYLFSFLDRPINDGNKLYANGDYKGALDTYMGVRQSEPANPLLFYNIGTDQYKLGQYDEARKELESAVRMPDKKLSSRAAYNLADAYFRSGEIAKEPSERIARWRESIAYLKKAIDIDNDFETQRRISKSFSESSKKKSISKKRTKTRIRTTTRNSRHFRQMQSKSWHEPCSFAKMASIPKQSLFLKI